MVFSCSYVQGLGMSKWGKVVHNPMKAFQVISYLLESQGFHAGGVSSKLDHPEGPAPQQQV